MRFWLIFLVLGGIALVFAFKWYAYSAIEPSTYAVTVMTYNIGSIAKEVQKKDTELLAAVINQADADVVLLQEAYSLKKAAQLAEKTGYRLLHFPGEKDSHVRIMSRLPASLLGTKHLTGTEGTEKTAVCAEVESPLGPLTVCSVHLKSIPYKYKELSGARRDILNKSFMAERFTRELFFPSPRSRQARELLQWVDSLATGPVVIGGDFNSFCLSRTIRLMTGQYQDTAWSTSAYFASSHKSLGFSLPVRGDYIFISRDLHYADTRIIPQSPGDHYPLVTKVFASSAKEERE